MARGSHHHFHAHKDVLLDGERVVSTAAHTAGQAAAMHAHIDGESVPRIGVGLSRQPAQPRCHKQQERLPGRAQGGVRERRERGALRVHVRAAHQYATNTMPFTHRNLGNGLNDSILLSVAM